MKSNTRPFPSSQDAVIVGFGAARRRTELAARTIPRGRCLRAVDMSGERVAIIGGGNSALRGLDAMVKVAEHVYMVLLLALKAAPLGRRQRRLELRGGFHGGLRGGG